MIDHDLMALALTEARKAADRGEVPVGAVLTDAAGVILAAAGNRTIELSDPSGHAEMLVLREAGRLLGNYRLTGTTLYVTLEPCLMCAGALIHARIGRVVYGAEDPKGGALVSRYRVGRDGLLNHSCSVEGGLCAEACSALLQDFFRQRRG
ncbi:MAG: tRNA adenosine(34) deaminase TadA [Thermodesulfobacteriota bacterium]